MPEHDYEVIIIGGGPSACAAGIRCAQHGLRTLLVFKQADDVAGPSESIHPGLETLLKGLEVGAGFSYTRSTYEGIYSGGQYRPLSTAAGEIWEGRHIDKGKFCSILQGAVRQKGCICIDDLVRDLVREDGQVSGITCSSGRVFKARFVIDCSGRQGIGGRSLGHRKKYYSPPLVAWSGRASGIDEAVWHQLATSFNTAENRWTWMAPEPPDSYSWTCVAKKGSKFFLPPDILKPFDSSPIKVCNARWGLLRPVVAPGILFCGDAAGMIDPAAGQGIFNAVVSGIMAANTIRQCFDRPEIESLALAQYDQWFLQQYEAKTAMLRAYYDELFPGWFDSKSP